MAQCRESLSLRQAENLKTFFCKLCLANSCFSRIFAEDRPVWPEVHCEASALRAHSGEAQPKKDRTYYGDFFPNTRIFSRAYQCTRKACTDGYH